MRAGKRYEFGIKRNGILALIVTALGAAPGWTQAQSTDHAHQGRDQMAPQAAPGDAPILGTRDPAGTNPGATSSVQEGSPAEHNMDAARQDTGQNGGMDHGDMKMQGGSAPPDARDPHAYAGSSALEGDKDAPARSRQLHLSDEHRYGSVLIDRLERVRGEDEYATAYDVQAWYGHQYDRVVIEAEGDYARGKLEEARTELLWGHALASYWDSRLGVRHDSGEGPDRTWLAAGVQGLAPYWFELDAMAYLGEQGRTALRIEAEYELLLTQRVVLQPRAELNLYGKRDEALGIGSGLSDGVAGLRLRYEFSRQFAPYLGVEWADKFGETEDLAREADDPTSETRWVAGVRFWY